MKGPHAFPVPSVVAGGEYEGGHDGMTLRDYFAAKALQALIPICETKTDAAKEAYSYADFMLEARNK